MAKLRKPEINMLMLSGTLTRDAELTYTAAGLAVCKFSIAHDRWVKSSSGGKGESVVMFVNCTLLGRSAEALAEKLLKGRNVIVEGNLRSRSAERDGQKRTYWEAFCNRVQFLDWGAHDDGEDAQPQRQPNHTTQRPAAQTEERSPVYAEDDIPF
jgi:single-strand DNA-binding protein